MEENKLSFIFKIWKRCIQKASSLQPEMFGLSNLHNKRVIQYITKRILIEKVSVERINFFFLQQHRPIKCSEADGQFRPPNRDIYVNITELIDAQLNQGKVSSTRFLGVNSCESDLLH